jgi:hypothetical protein
MEIQTTSLDFSQPVSGSGPRTTSQTLVFPRQVDRAVAGLTGYFAEYAGQNDHHLGQLTVQLDTAINANTVTVTGTFGLRDWSGNWDDAYDGNIECVVLVDLAAPTQVPPRTDLLITGAELNQAVQFFRASTYLDPANVMPDNAIWLVARKNTGVRVYVDYEPDGTLPPITNLTGALIIQNNSTTVTLQSINPGQAITPRGDSEINMIVADQTLNFMIPASLCTGTVQMTCTVWDQADATQRPSPLFSRTLTFTDVQPLSLFLVGVSYTAVTPNLAAPTQAAISAALFQLIKTYPVGDFIETGYQTLAYGKVVTGNVASGSPGFDDLLSKLNELRGSSPDIYLGVLPAGVIETAGNTIGGDAIEGGKAAGVFVDSPADIPHEIGHNLGRLHAPCSPGMCNPPPKDVDPNYPQYAAFPAGSIGVIGFDATTDTTFDPSSTFDFMAYAFPQWVSAYTYTGLRGASFGPTTGSATSGAMAHPVQGVAVDTLFLSLTIARDRAVVRHPSFHFPAPLFGTSGCQSQFTVEFQDDQRNVLGCSPLTQSCTTGCDCWPKKISNDIAFPPGSRWFVIWEGDRQLHEEHIPDPPPVRIEGSGQEAGGVRLRWSAPESQSRSLWYLVQWLDGDSWRGVAPRQRETSLLIPGQLFTDSPELTVRVLATSGIATGIAEATLHFDGYQSTEPELSLRGLSTDADLPAALPNVIEGVVRDNGGRQLTADTMAWFADAGVHIGNGPWVDLRTLSPGEHEVRAVVRRLGGHALTRSWIVERAPSGFVLKQAVPPEQIDEPDEDHPHPHES